MQSCSSQAPCLAFFFFLIPIWCWHPYSAGCHPKEVKMYACCAPAHAKTAPSEKKVLCLRVICPQRVTFVLSKCMHAYCCFLKHTLPPSSVCCHQFLFRGGWQSIPAASPNSPLLPPRPASHRTLKIQRSCLLISRGD